MMRRASAFASSSEAALRRSEARIAPYTTAPSATTTKTTRTSRTPFMTFSVPTGKGQDRRAIKRAAEGSSMDVLILQPSTRGNGNPPKAVTGSAGALLR